MSWSHNLHIDSSLGFIDEVFINNVETFNGSHAVDMELNDSGRIVPFTDETKHATMNLVRGNL